MCVCVCVCVFECVCVWCACVYICMCELVSCENSKQRLVLFWKINISIVCRRKIN